MIPHFLTNQLQATIDYYTRVLLFDIVLHPGELADSSCMLQLGEDAIIFEETSTKVDHQSWGRLHFFVDDLEKTFQNVADFADVRANPEKTEVQTREFKVRDCNGIELVFAEVESLETGKLGPQIQKV